jgi:hypothetical protein
MTCRVRREGLRTGSATTLHPHTARLPAKSVRVLLGITAQFAWLACSVLAHNLGIWTTIIGEQPRVTHRTRRTRIINLPAVIVNHAGNMLLRFPARCPWADQFNKMLNNVRAQPAPSG